MADWATAVTAIGTTAIGAGAALGGAHVQARTADALRREEHWRERRTTYRLLIDSLVRFRLAMNDRSGAVSFNFDAWSKSYTHLLNGVLLFAPEAVRRAAGDFDGALEALLTEAGGRRDTDALRARYTDRANTLDDQGTHLVEAMRNDLAPDERGGWWRRLARRFGR